MLESSPAQSPSPLEAESSTATILLTPSADSPNVEAISLSEGQHSVGADPACDVVVPGSGIAGTHCQIVVDTQQTVVKAQSPLTWINDGQVTEGPLNPGDRLTLGPIEFEVSSPDNRTEPGVGTHASEIEEILHEAAARDELSAAAEATDQDVERHHDALTREVSGAGTFELDFAGASVEERAGTGQQRAVEQTQHSAVSRDVFSEERAAIEQSRAALQQQREHLTLLADSLDKRDQELSRRHSEISSLRENLSELESRLGQERNELASERAALVADRERRDAEQDRLKEEQAELQRQHDELIARQEDLSQQREQLTQSEQALNSHEQELGERSRSLHAEVDRTRQARRELNDDRKALDQEREHLASEFRALDDRGNTLNDEQQVLIATRGALRSQREQLQQQRQDVEEREAHMAQERERLRRLEESLGNEQDAITRERKELERQNSSLLEERASVEAQRARLDADRANLDLLQHRITCDQTTLDEERQSLNDRQSRLEALEQAHGIEHPPEDDTPSSHEGEREQLNEIRRELEQERAEFDAQREQLDRQQREIEDQRRAVESERQSLGESRAELISEQAAFEAKREEISRQQEEEGKVENGPTDGDAQRVELMQILEDERARVQEEQDALRREREALIAKRQELEQAQEEFEEERIQLEEQAQSSVRQAADLLQQDRNQLDERWEAMRREREQLFEQQQALEDERRALQDQQDSPDVAEHGVSFTSTIEPTPDSAHAVDSVNEWHQSDGAAGDTDMSPERIADEQWHLQQEILPPAITPDGGPGYTADAGIADQEWSDTNEDQPGLQEWPTAEDAFQSPDDSVPAAFDPAHVIEEHPAVHDLAMAGYAEEPSGDGPDPLAEALMTDPGSDDTGLGEAAGDVEVTDLRDRLSELFGTYPTEPESATPDASSDEAAQDPVIRDEESEADNHVVVADEVVEEVVSAPEEDFVDLEAALVPDGPEAANSECALEELPTPEDEPSDESGDIVQAEEAQVDQQQVQGPDDADDEDSIALYMERLLGRSSVPRPKAPPAPPLPAPQPDAEIESAAESTPSADEFAEPEALPAEIVLELPDNLSPAAEPPPVPEIVPPPPHEAGSGVVPSAPAGPEAILVHTSPDVQKDTLRANMDSFRELANMSARTAVAQHASKRLWSTVQLKVALTGIGFAVTATLIAAEVMGIGTFLVWTTTAGLITLGALVELVRTLVSYFRWQSIEQGGDWDEQAEHGQRLEAVND